MAEDRGTVFYSRLHPERLNAQPLSELPQEARRFAQLAQLTPEEVQELTKSHMLDSKENPNVKSENLKSLDRAIAARYREIGFAELFGLSEEEASAYRDLMNLVDSDYDAAIRYADDAGTLSPAEKSHQKTDGISQ